MTPTLAPTAGLPPPAQYFPVHGGRYAMKAGLVRLGTSFGNGDADKQLFQIDHQWPSYRRNKLRSRAESLNKYYCLAAGFDDECRRALTEFLLHRLQHEHPARFRAQKHPGGERTLHSGLSGEALHFDGNLRWLGADPEVATGPAYGDGLDALACQIQEDLSFVSATPADRGRVLLLHLCAPNHWAADRRIGRSFQAAHAPVPQFQRIARQTPALLNNLRDRGPYVRFAWGLATDTHLNHHPQPPTSMSADPRAWHGRDFDPAEPQLFIRVERQVLYGIPAANGFLFAIRTYFTDVTRLPAHQRRVLAAAVRAMDLDIAQYKGLADRQASIAAWLESISAED